MFILKAIVTLFLLPGNIAIGALGLSVEQDGGIIRSFVNMVFWGLIIFLSALPFILP